MNLDFDKRTTLYDRIFKNSKPLWMDFGKFCNHVYEFCQFEDAKSVQFSSVVTNLLEIRLKIDICGEFQANNPTHIWAAHPVSLNNQGCLPLGLLNALCDAQYWC